MIRQFISANSFTMSLRAVGVLFVIFCCTVAAIADTIRLRDGSVIRGEVVGFGEGQFTVLIGSGARSGRRSRVTLYAEDVEAIEFDSATGATSSVTTGGEPGFGANTSTTNSRPVLQTPRPSDTAASPDDSSPAPATASPAPTFRGTPVRVRADATSNGWTNTGITVRRGQLLRITATGRVTLGQGRTANPAGVRTIADSGKLMRDEPTGALIAVIGDNNDDFIFIGARREFTAQRDGVLFLGVNEANLGDNTGSYEATVGVEEK